MASYSRASGAQNQLIELRSVFTNPAGVFVQPTSGPVVYIYDPSVSDQLIFEELEAEVFTNALAGPLTPTEISTGFYELSYLIPNTATPGLWRDVWVSTVETTASNAVLGFTVVAGAVIQSQVLHNNELIIIELASSITGYTGISLYSDIQLSFVTTLSPYYASPDLMRMEIGPWIDFIPDSTLALMIHWSSKEADFIMSGSRSTAPRVQFARAKFVSYDALMRALYLPGSGNFQAGGNGSGGAKSKKLGDLSISSSEGSTIARTASGIDTATLAHIRSQRDEWWRVVNAGAEIVPGQSLGFEAALRGVYDPDRRLGGRAWASPDEVYYSRPGVNAKGVMPGSRKGKFYQANNLPSSYRWH